MMETFLLFYFSGGLAWFMRGLWRAWIAKADDEIGAARAMFAEITDSLWLAYPLPVAAMLAALLVAVGVIGGACLCTLWPFFVVRRIHEQMKRA